MAVLKADLRVGETLRIDGTGSATITLAAKSGQRARLYVDADPGLTIHPPERPDVRDVIRGGLTSKRTGETHADQKVPFLFEPAKADQASG